jgi:hypothetical protein
MANIVVYRTYPFKSTAQDPIIEELTDALKKEELDKKPGIAAELSGVSSNTLRNWLSGKTRSPRYATVAAVFGALGYHSKFDRTGRFDLAAERADAKRWHSRRKASKLAAKERQTAQRKINHKETRVST